MFPLPFPSIPAKVVAAGLVLIAAFVTGLVYGMRLEGKEHAEYVAQQAAAAVAIVTRQGATTTRWRTRYVDVATQSQQAAQAIQSEVQGYANAGACLDPTWVRLHDAAALGALPRPTNGTAGGMPKASADAVERYPERPAGARDRNG